MANRQFSGKVQPGGLPAHFVFFFFFFFNGAREIGSIEISVIPLRLSFRSAWRLL
jgi:hypothetical protein